ncbi:MAG: DUF547 domain-containing protein [Candidatus Schekmanbacteria bacterium]|nr:DUF547 domain-containing protein [Candidatus Schekmanbacteria bacterium]
MSLMERTAQALRDAADILGHARGPVAIAAALLPKSLRPLRILNDLPTTPTPTPTATATATQAQAGSPDAIATKLRQLRNRLKAEIVRAGRVDYAALSRSQAFAELQAASVLLRGVSPADMPDDRARIAFWTNLYNVLVMHGVINLRIERSVMEMPAFFSTVAYKVGAHVFTLDDIENGVLRRNGRNPATGRPQLRHDDARLACCPTRLDPRIHAALVCAAASCPAVAFYDAGQLDAQLEAAACNWLAGAVAVEHAARSVRVPLALRYYAEDFGGSTGVWRFVAAHVDVEQRLEIAAAQAAGYKLGYARYDWSLNQTLG